MSPSSRETNRGIDSRSVGITSIPPDGIALPPGSQCQLPVLLGVGFLIVVLAGAFSCSPRFRRSGASGFSSVPASRDRRRLRGHLLLRSWRELNAAQQLLELATGNLGQA